VPENPARKYVEKEVCIKVKIKKWVKSSQRKNKILSLRMIC
jgi:hypothetical protein